MAKWFRKLPVAIQAVQNIPENREELIEFLGPDDRNIGWMLNERTGALHIHTLEGIMKSEEGDWVIRGVKGEFYSCKKDIFNETYEPTENAYTGVV